jgi:hypothetical protein
LGGRDRLDGLEARGLGGDDVGLRRFERLARLGGRDGRRRGLFGFRSPEQPPEKRDSDDEPDDRDDPVFL